MISARFKPQLKGGRFVSIRVPCRRCHFARQSLGGAEDAEEQFDIDVGLMKGELSLFLDDLAEALGGEKIKA